MIFKRILTIGKAALLRRGRRRAKLASSFFYEMITRMKSKTFPPAAVAPHPLSIDDLSEVEEWHRAMEMEIALSRAKAWCLRAESLFAYAQESGVADFTYEPGREVRLRMINPKGPRFSPIDANKLSPEEQRVAAGTQLNITGMLTRYTTLATALKKMGVLSGGEPLDSNRGVDEVGSAAAALGRSLLGDQAYGAWMSEREMLRIDEAMPSGAPAARSAPRV